MKKMMAVATMALMAVVAQAVTMTWSTGADDSIYNGSGNEKKIPSTTMVSSSGVTSGSYSLLVTMNSTLGSTTNATIAKFGLWAAGSAYIYAYGSGNDTFNGHIGAEKANGATGGKWPANSENLPDIVAGDQYLVTFLFELTNGGLVGTAYANKVGTETVTQIFSFTDSYGGGGLNVQTFENNAWTINETAAYEGLLSTDNLAWMTKNRTAILPEPTCLALLALGVAGIALKRKVA